MLLAARLLLTVVAAASTLVPRPANLAARRWNATGHEVIAAIAWNHMTPTARAKAVALLRNGPPQAHLGDLEPSSGAPDARARELFVLVSTWSDLIRDRNIAQHAYDHGTWHYSDSFWKEKDGKIEPVPEMKPDLENAVERIGVMESTLAGSGPDSTRALALAWMEHLVGDIHQPLHASARVTPESPKGDKGGNDFKLAGNVSNLHSYWDRILDLVDPPTGDRAADVDRWAAQIEQRLPMNGFKASELGAGVDVWAKESLDLSEHVLYPASLAERSTPSDEYRKLADVAAERRIALAGYRLATALNRILR
ncbi:MAG: S1/P1 nuclease [Gemmatimonadetes bacterium]|nr:S1/P1 nuclease [Gemmatimonadota bacterium]MBI3568407.1 S1/P1 nuclease [Gemmatimonadota bacterium]